MSIRKIDKQPPADLSAYLGADGMLNLCVSQNSILWKLVHHKSGKYKAHLIQTRPEAVTPAAEQSLPSFSAKSGSRDELAAGSRAA